ncbi:polysialyltransferase family glycosyltransferase [Brevibacterium gallinarum]|uniref:Uncharacterized protein n=1 Tax=Brevibacterium gallinarum TaxID=2762220 RepID=A0ABR8WWN0_9MICO|nr:polysialyltransferase family glycosyltransferase [Brevibacterium gallinarum]MBD8021313.1 hypothetical protein [Brevibacterium gallinarum]
MTAQQTTPHLPSAPYSSAAGPASGAADTVQVFLASTALEVVFLAAGIDAGCYDSAVAPAVIRTTAQPRPAARARERILLLSDNAAVLEQATPLHSALGLSSLMARFDRVLTLNESITPHHPNTWAPAEADLPMLQRLLRSHWELGTSDVELIVESPQVNPAIALARIFSESLIRVSADGLMSYGPTRSRLPLGMQQRMTTLHYAPLAPDLQPRLLHETGIVPVPVPLEAVSDVIAEVRENAADMIDAAAARLTGERTGIILGQYCAALGLITESEESELHCQMAEAVLSAGCKTVAFKPHPAAPTASTAALAAHVTAHGGRFVVIDTPVIAEALITAIGPAIVVSAFSTSLMLVAQLYGCQTAAVGSRLLLQRLRPYENSNRIPLTIIDQFAHRGHADIDPQAHGDESMNLQDLVDAVSYCMQPRLLPAFRQRTSDLLARLDDDTRGLYFTRGTLSALDLPGRLPRRSHPRTTARRAGRLGSDYLLYRARRAIRRSRTRRAAERQKRRQR